jgi:hypothetical protein
VPEPELQALRRLRAELTGALGERLCELLAADEVAATLRRIDRLLRRATFPEPGGQWPAVPWPPM